MAVLNFRSAIFFLGAHIRISLAYFIAERGWHRDFQTE
jgi:hypothetical protein